MADRLTVAPRREFQSFHDFPICLDLDALDAAELHDLHRVVSALIGGAR